MWPRITKCNCFVFYYNITHLRPFITYSHSITMFNFFVFIELEHYIRVYILYKANNCKHLGILSYSKKYINLWY